MDECGKKQNINSPHKLQRLSVKDMQDLLKNTGISQLYKLKRQELCDKLVKLENLKLKGEKKDKLEKKEPGPVKNMDKIDNNTDKKHKTKKEPTKKEPKENHHDILFYEPKAPFYEFSNFYPCKFTLLDREWTCSEQYFQAMKFYIPENSEHMEYVDMIHHADSPMKIFSLGLQKKQGGYGAKWVINKKTKTINLNDVIQQYRHLSIRDDWDSIKLDVMMDVLKAKFSQNKKLKELLMSTGNANIIEDSPRDSYWGIGKDKKGQNHLGKLLVKLREILKKTK